MQEQFENTKRDIQNPYIQKEQTTPWPTKNVQNINIKLKIK